MAEASSNRRLAAILAADVVGYSRLMAADEAGTHAALRRHREAVFDPTVAANHGRIVKLIGDGTLAEFASVVDAVNCAVAIQRILATAVETGPKITLRIGVNLGDIIIDGDDIYGDGVNVAARLEPLAEPGGICVSSIVNESVGTRIGVKFVDGGEVQVKNIDRPIRIWKWHPESRDTKEPVAEAVKEPIVLPSLAVLPFQNMSGDAEQEYFADGIVEDIITALSRFKTLAVIARNSSFVYKGHAVDVRRASAELGVRYLLEGSVRRAGSRLRLTAQLVDGTNGVHLWASNFDGAVDDVFAFQDSITESVVAIVEPTVKKAEIERARQKAPSSLGAYDLYLQALALVLSTGPNANARTIDLIERSLKLDPNYAPAQAVAANAYVAMFDRQQAGGSEDARLKGVAYARSALASAGADANVRATAAGSLIILAKEYETGLTALRQAAAENPNNVNVIAWAGAGELRCGSLEEAERWFLRVIRLNPGDFGGPWVLCGLAGVKMAEGKFAEARDWAIRAHAVDPTNDIIHWALASIHAHLGEMDAARKWREELQSLAPNTTLASIRRGQETRDPHRLDILLDGLRKAGLPEV